MLASNFRSHRSSRRVPSRRSQRGAAAIFFAVSLIAFLLAIGFALDLARLYHARADLQRLASTSALSAVRQVSACATDQQAGPDELATLIDNALLGNGVSALDLESITSAITPGVQTLDGNLRALDSGQEMALADSVSVTLSQAMPQPFIPFLPTPEDAEIQATATAAQTVVGRLAIGTNLLTLNTEDSVILNALLGGLLGTSVNLSLADYNGLVNADITLLDLVEITPSVANVDDLLSLGVTLPGALGIVGDALNATGEAVEVAAGALLNGLAAVASAPVGNIQLGDYIGVDEGMEDAVGNVSLNALDLLLGLSQLANEGYGVSFAVPGLTSISIPGVIDVNVSAHLKVGEAPQEALGRPGYLSNGDAITSAHSSQVLVVLDISVDLLPIGSFSLLGLGLGLAVEAAPGTADLVRVQCPSPNSPQMIADVYADTTAAEIALGGFDVADADPIGDAEPLVVLQLLGIELLKIDPVITVPLGSADSGIVSFSGPFVPDIDEPAANHTQSISVDPGDLLSDAISGLLPQVSANLVSNIPVLGLVLAPLLNPVINLALAIVDPILTAVGTAVLEPLLQLLGVSIGTAEITVKSVSVDQPYLFDLS